MTAIAAVKEGGTVWIGGDAAGVAGYSIQTRSDPKVFVNGPMIIGYTSSFRMGNLLQYVFSPPEVSVGQSGMAYMVKRFIPAVKECLKDGGFQQTQNQVDEGGTFLVGFNGDLFEVEDDYQVGRVTQDYHACGCGRDILLGSLHATQNLNLSAKDRILAALTAAAEFSAGVRGPFTILSGPPS
ncbi:MAG: hypothetical protein JNL58_23930 [Planctomyces sp.]|nr:hypothetical protein [Planctomyces sp.]